MKRYSFDFLRKVYVNINTIIFFVIMVLPAVGSL